jgi:hypothetical protein
VRNIIQETGVRKPYSIDSGIPNCDALEDVSPQYNWRWEVRSLKELPKQLRPLVEAARKQRKAVRDRPARAPLRGAGAGGVSRGGGRAAAAGAGLRGGGGSKLVVPGASEGRSGTTLQVLERARAVDACIALASASLATKAHAKKLAAAASKLAKLPTFEQLQVRRPLPSPHQHAHSLAALLCMPAPACVGTYHRAQGA